MTASSEAVRLRHARELFERAVADGVDMTEAKRRLRADRWADADRALAEKRCGTRVVAVEEGGRELAWFQR